MASVQALARLQKVVWILIYGGLLTLVLGLFTQRTDEAVGWTLLVIGGVLAAFGVVLIWVRSRLKPDA
jgi:predicted membrane channel-forming protein YqfA (hemolysin III family)